MKSEEVRESCREWVDEKSNRCGDPAIVIVWGKLFDPEALGPRCEFHVEGWLAKQGGVWNLQDALRQGYAIFDLRGLRRDK